MHDSCHSICSLDCSAIGPLKPAGHAAAVKWPTRKTNRIQANVCRSTRRAKDRSGLREAPFSELEGARGPRLTTGASLPLRGPEASFRFQCIHAGQVFCDERLDGACRSGRRFIATKRALSTSGQVVVRGLTHIAGYAAPRSLFARVHSHSFECAVRVCGKALMRGVKGSTRATVDRHEWIWSSSNACWFRRSDRNTFGTQRR